MKGTEWQRHKGTKKIEAIEGRGDIKV